MKASNTSILLIYTGGTIGMIKNTETGTLENFNFEHLEKHVPELKKFNFPIDTYQFNPPIDSSDIEPEAWKQLTQIIAHDYDKYSGFIILHGTDTMAYTASALSFMLEGLAKPVILTGSQLPISEMRTDGKENLLTSIEIATAKNHKNEPMVPEVSIFFENHLMRGNRTTKMNAENFNAFQSFNFPILAEAGIHIKFNELHYNRNKKLKPHYLLDTNIALIKLFPGIQENVVDAILNIKGLKGIVIETYGSGNAPQLKWFTNQLKKANEKGIIIVNVTQCNAGAVEMKRYKTGHHLMENGVVCGYDSTTESAITKLMFLFGHNYTTETIKKIMNEPLAGEITTCTL